MAKVAAYHTILKATSPERDVHHDDSDCADGLRIKPEHKTFDDKLMTCESAEPERGPSVNRRKGL